MANQPNLNPEIVSAFQGQALQPNPVQAVRALAKTLHAQTPLSQGALFALSKLVQIQKMPPRLVQFMLRAACGYEPVPGSAKVVEWLQQHPDLIGRVLEPDLHTCPLTYSDWSVTASDFIAPEQYEDAASLTQRIWADIKASGAVAAIGGYNHIRPAYGGGLFASETGARTVHLGLDVFIEPESPVFAPLDGVVHSFANNAAKFDYGPCVVLEHKVAPDVPIFYTLYGHLSLESLDLVPGQSLKKGDRLGNIGNYPDNGDWPPHLHLQLVMDMLDKAGDYSGSCHPDQLEVWLSLCPDANLITRIPKGLFPQVLPAFACSETPKIVARGPNGHNYDACGQRRN